MLTSSLDLAVDTAHGTRQYYTKHLQ